MSLPGVTVEKSWRHSWVTVVLQGNASLAGRHDTVTFLNTCLTDWGNGRMQGRSAHQDVGPSSDPWSFLTLSSEIQKFPDPQPYTVTVVVVVINWENTIPKIPLNLPLPLNILFFTSASTYLQHKGIHNFKIYLSISNGWWVYGSVECFAINLLFPSHQSPNFVYRKRLIQTMPWQRNSFVRSNQTSARSGNGNPPRDKILWEDGVLSPPTCSFPSGLQTPNSSI